MSDPRAKKEADRRRAVVRNLKESFSMLPLANLAVASTQLTQTRGIKAALSEIPDVIKEYYTDGTSPASRPLGFYQHLRQEAEKILRQCEAEEQQQVMNSKIQSSCLPNIVVHLRLPSSGDVGDNDIDVSWISESIESTLDCTRMDVIDQPLSMLIRPDDYNLLYRILMEWKREMHPERSRTLEPLPCHIAPLWRTRGKKDRVSYQNVILQGVVRLWPTPKRILPTGSSDVGLVTPPIYWPTQTLAFVREKIICYETIHSVVDMSILWVDERITMVNFWNPEDVRGKSPWDYIASKDHSHAKEIHNLTLAMGRNAVVSYAFNTKGQGIIFQRSYGRPFLYYPVNNQPIQSFNLISIRISEEEYLEDQRKAKEEMLSVGPSLSDEGAKYFLNLEANMSFEQSSPGCESIFKNHKANFPFEDYFVSTSPKLDVLNPANEAQFTPTSFDHGNVSYGNPMEFNSNNSVFDSPISFTDSPDRVIHLSPTQFI